MAEALELGSCPSDWCCDYEHGFIQEATKIVNVSLKQFSQNKDAIDRLLLLMRRSVAENKAKAVLEASRKVVDADVVDVLQSWVTRLNGLSDGQTFVFSDTMGLISDRCGTHSLRPLAQLWRSTRSLPCSQRPRPWWLTPAYPSTYQQTHEPTCHCQSVGSRHRVWNRFER